jgi:hypothetical protein
MIDMTFRETTFAEYENKDLGAQIAVGWLS